MDDGWMSVGWTDDLDGWMDDGWMEILLISIETESIA